MADNPYDILGVGKQATDADIKAAYRKLAKKHHPDLNPGDAGAVARFKQLNLANDLLSDKAKRAAFDRGEIDMQGQPSRPEPQQRYYRDFAQAPQGNRYHSSTGDFDMADLEGLFSGFGGLGSAMRRQPQSRDMHYTIDVDFLEAARGAKKRLTMPDNATLDITLPEGIEEGQKLRLKGKGKPASRTAPAGDAYVEVHIRPHPFFSRKDNDITVEVPVALHESILGGKIQVPTVHGPVDMNIPKGAGPDLVLRLKGKGIKGGDQYVKLKIVMPATIDAQLEQAIRAWAEKYAYNPRKHMESAL